MYDATNTLGYVQRVIVGFLPSPINTQLWSANEFQTLRELYDAIAFPGEPERWVEVTT